ncbi:hypothetical protein L226DRAFT_566531 [Lentinus tigrinus ALCF2SS1-7]|uniref:TEA domain-containing protein n=1 Tax=Lentinus tigrinus ALCF2SS1-6 TaxID=1328759 RepID=A0A5C2SSK1_9APHY|nr:hypothetical protein L227DRAFT_606195 [Lentinus tigrinus ALCF2SS1-6]RPD79986.1 hypothetical protein L226DRAFT_566531 [Lentinus tigrinus ALCF2SS1-7]
MGREVVSVYRRRKYTFASLSPSPSRLSSATNSSMESLSGGPPSNLTPARKHHKLLKDGSEVWSKDVEKIFVEGLRQYWQSPWATYSRGRSRWRNQFLVDHLKKAGVERTKKQVASHIQVLRNMWRGQPEFHLVAGGEELFQENGLLANTNKKSTSSPSPSVSPRRAELHESPAASSASSPECHTSDFPSDLPAASFPSLSPPSQLSSFPELGVEDVFSSPPSSTRLPDPAFCLSSSPRTTHPVTPVSVKLEPLAMDPTLFTLPQMSFTDSPTDYTLSVPNRIAHLYFWADGMVPLTLDVDRLVGATPSSPSRTFLHLRVSMPPLADLRCPPNLQGVNGAVSFATPWTSLAKCQTKSWGSGRTVMSQDLGLFTQVTTPELQSTLAADPSSSQMVYAYLPDSALSRCHWLDNVHTITQQLVVDNEVLAVLVYHIERIADATRAAPAMELIGFQKYPWRGVPPPSSASSSAAFQLFASPSPPVSPTSSSFPHPHAYPSAPLSPQSPLFPRSSISSSSGTEDASTQMLYSYPPPQPYAYTPYAIDPR